MILFPLCGFSDLFAELGLFGVEGGSVVGGDVCEGGCAEVGRGGGEAS